MSTYCVHGLFYNHVEYLSHRLVMYYCVVLVNQEHTAVYHLFLQMSSFVVTGCFLPDNVPPMSYIVSTARWQSTAKLPMTYT